jgi:hypothetical protein
MEPEGVVHVLRQLVGALADDGVVVDLNDALEAEELLVDDLVVGQLDRSRFVPRAEAASAGLDQLVAEGVLVPVGDERVTIRVRYPSGPEVVDDVSRATYTRMPPELAHQLLAVEREVVRREVSRVRSFRMLSCD